jgi:Bacterial Ig-like domain (group 1)
MKAKLLATILAVLGAGLALAPAAANATGTLDQQQTDTSGGAELIGDLGHISAAQTFTAGLSGALDQVDLFLLKSGGGSPSPTLPLTVEIRTVDGGGAPSATVLASALVPASSVPACCSGAFVPVAFTLPAAVVAGTQYAIVAYTADSVGGYFWPFSSGDVYTGGAHWFSLRSPPTTWTTLGGSDLAFKTYVTVAGPGPPATLTLAPKSATNPVDTQHCVTATVKDAAGNATSFVTVRFSVTGSVTTSGSQTTDANGQAQFCYTGPALPGADSISAYADTNNSTTQDLGEPSDTATKTWTLPTNVTPCVIKISNGGWIVTDDGDRGSFGGNAKESSTGTDTGQEEYQDHGPAEPMDVHSLNVLAITCNTNLTQASIFGQAQIDGSGTHDYRIDVQDNGEPGKLIDRYRIRLDTGYDSGDHILRGGNVQIH